jgi:superkiller protein 3
MCSPFRKLGLLLIFILAFGLLLSPATFAQNRGFGGRIVNEKGELVANAKIKIVGQSSKREYTTTSDKRGQWVYMNLPPGGAYWIVVRAEGYSPAYKQSDAAAGMTTLDFQLTPGDPNQKFPFELSPEEQEKLKQEQNKARELAKVFGEIKESFDAARALADQGKYDDAIVEFKKALEKAPDEPTVLANLADAQMKAGHSEEALESYKKAIAKKPDDSSLWINYGTVLNNLGKTAESKEAFKKAAELNPGAKGQSLYNLGVTQMNAMQTQEAIATFRQAIEADPNYAEAYFRLGQCLLSDQSTIAEAIKTLEKYIQIGKDATNVQTAKEIVAALKK